MSQCISIVLLFLYSYSCFVEQCNYMLRAYIEKWRIILVVYKAQRLSCLKPSLTLKLNTPSTDFIFASPMIPTISQLYMFRAIFSPIIRSTWLYLQYLVEFNQVAVCWCLEWVETTHSRLLVIFIVVSRRTDSWTLNLYRHLFKGIFFRAYAYSHLTIRLIVT